VQSANRADEPILLRPALPIKERTQMILDTGTMVAIMIALACSCFVMVLSIVKYGALYRENQELTEKLKKGKK
jgi:cell division protein FtsX